MLMVFLSIHAAIFINSLPPGKKFKSDYFCEQMLGRLFEILHIGRTVGSLRPIAHVDNAAPHRSTMPENRFHSCQFCHAPQPLYSADISPCDFFLFDDRKPKPRYEEFELMDELQGRFEELLAQIIPETVQ
jgi:hypothetical protein